MGKAAFTSYYRIFHDKSMNLRLKRHKEVSMCNESPSNQRLVASSPCLFRRHCNHLSNHGQTYQPCLTCSNAITVCGLAMKPKRVRFFNNALNFSCMSFPMGASNNGHPWLSTCEEFHTWQSWWNSDFSGLCRVFCCSGPSFAFIANPVNKRSWMG